jgi:hypothetical protein
MKLPVLSVNLSLIVLSVLLAKSGYAFISALPGLQGKVLISSASGTKSLRHAAYGRAATAPM